MKGFVPTQISKTSLKVYAFVLTICGLVIASGAPVSLPTGN